MSFLPGLGLTNPTSTTNLDPSERPTKTITLQAGSEYRFEVPASTTVTITVLLESAASLDTPTGTAEVFGTELAPNHPYDFLSLTKAAIYTHHGCSLSVTGTCDSDYVAEETPMTEYANVHFALETMRQADNAMGGPRVLVVGPKDSGKTTLIRTLTAYATRTSRTPVVVNLDPSEGMLCLPGSVSAAVFGTGATLDPEDAASSGWGSSPVGGPSPTPVKTPLVYHCGFERAEERAEVFKPVVTRLALAATSRFEEDPMVKRSGLLVDVGGSLGRSEGYDVLAHIVGELSSKSSVSRCATERSVQARWPRADCLLLVQLAKHCVLCSHIYDCLLSRSSVSRISAITFLKRRN
jgi:polyribonucleotide 5'-hydroxyl-kinase